jgi:hypothetical protein
MTCPILKECDNTVTFKEYRQMCSDEKNWEECEYFNQDKRAPSEWYKFVTGDEPV